MKPYRIIPIVLICMILAGSMLEGTSIQHSAINTPMASQAPYNFTFNKSSYIYIVTVAQLTDEQPAYNATDVNSVAFTLSGPSWLSLGTGDQVEINPPPTLPFNSTTDNYGTYKAYLNGTAIINGTTTEVYATTILYITVVKAPTSTITKVVSSISTIFHVPEKVVLIVIGASIITILVVVAFVGAAAQKKRYEIEEEKYEKIWLK